MSFCIPYYLFISLSYYLFISLSYYLFISASYDCCYVFLHSPPMWWLIFFIVLECLFLSVFFYLFSKSLLVHFLKSYCLFYLCSFFSFRPTCSSVVPLGFFWIFACSNRFYLYFKWNFQSGFWVCLRVLRGNTHFFHRLISFLPRLVRLILWCYSLRNELIIRYIIINSSSIIVIIIGGGGDGGGGRYIYGKEFIIRNQTRLRNFIFVALIQILRPSIDAIQKKISSQLLLLLLLISNSIQIFILKTYPKQSLLISN